MKIHSWKDVTKYLMDNGEESDLWDYICGLKGPDSDTNTWKKLITCVIRGQCTMAYGIEATRSYLTLWDDNDIIDALNKEMIFLSSHWFNHSIFALDCLASYYSKIDDSKMSHLLSELSYKLDNRSAKAERINIVTNVREIIEELYKEE